MTAISERYRRLAAGVTDKIAQVPPDRWSAPSPCPDWTALDVVRHLTETPGIFFGMIGEAAPEVPSVEDDPLAAWVAARDATQAALDDPSIASREYEGFAGKSTFEKGVGQFICTDLIVHGWDLARRCGPRRADRPTRPRRRSGCDGADGRRAAQSACVRSRDRGAGRSRRADEAARLPRPARLTLRLRSRGGCPRR